MVYPGTVHISQYGFMEARTRRLLDGCAFGPWLKLLIAPKPGLGQDNAGWLPPQLLHTCACRHRANVQLLRFHSLHTCPDGRNCVDPPGLAGLADNATTAASTALTRVCISGSGSPLSAHSSTVCVEPKQSSHRDLAWALPVKQMV